MDRYKRGMPLEGRRQPHYHEGEFPDLSGLDLSEIQMLRKQAAEQVEEYKANLAKQEENNRKMATKKLEDEIAKLKDQLKATNPVQTQNNSLA